MSCSNIIRQSINCVLLCKERDKLTVEYVLRDITKPIGVSEYGFPISYHKNWWMRYRQLRHQKRIKVKCRIEANDMKIWLMRNDVYQNNNVCRFLSLVLRTTKCKT